MTNFPPYLAEAKPIPWTSRAPWYKTIAPTYLGIMLWFVFWQDLVKGDGSPGGVLSVGVMPALFGIIAAALICHFLFYMPPAMLGVKTGLPLYIVGTSTYGARGGLFMPGFLTGLLQFGWLAVNAWAVGKILCSCFNLGLSPSPAGAMEATVPGWPHGIIATVFAVLAAFVGLKGIQYVARVATYLPLIPLAILLILAAITWSGLKGYSPEKIVAAVPAADVTVPEVAPEPLENPIATVEPLGYWGVIGVLITYIVGFFATAGAAGADIAMSSRRREDVHVGGVAGILIPTVVVSEITLLVIAGAYGGGMVKPENLGSYNPVVLLPDILGSSKAANIALIALAISSFPAACFSAFIAANSFKATMPKVNPFLSVGIGTLVAVILAVTGVVGNVIWVFQVIGASFGPVCGAMLADFLLAGRKWSGPRAGFNPAGWVSWVVGFVVGAFNLVVDLLKDTEWAKESLPNLADWANCVPVPPVSAFIVGFALYVAMAVLGARTRKLVTTEATA